jgi:Ras-related GTP-binding protein A/B
MAKKKVLLMGKAHSGKTSMRSIIFANYLARDTTRLSPTLDVEHHHVRFLGDLVLNLWDCGGQDAFYESYFERDRETIFRSVELLIYVFDIESDCPEKDFDHFCGVLEAIEENSPDARVFILIHKMDLVAVEDRDTILEDRKRLIADSCRACGVENFQCYGTSIWDETLYKAWSEIVTNLIPNIRLLETHLNNFCKLCDADEVVLFERATFLVISHAQATDNYSSSNEYLQRTPPALEGSTPPTSASAIGELGDAGQFSQENPSLASSPRTGPMDDGSDMPALGGSVDAMSGSMLGGVDSHGGPPTTIDPTDISSAASPSAAMTKHNMMASSNHQNPHQQLQIQRNPRNHHYLNHHHVSRTPHFDAHRFEKISNIVKQFKLSCGKAQSQFQGMQVRNSRFSAFIDAFTANTYIMVIVSDPRVHTAATLLNIQNARNHFERFIPRI